jgi:hypothetical protein
MTRTTYTFQVEMNDPLPAADFASQIQLNFTNQSPDSLTWKMSGLFDADLPFSYLDFIRFFKIEDTGDPANPTTTTMLFSGRVKDINRTATGGGQESVDCAAVGPWWELEQHIYSQKYRMGAPIPGDTPEGETPPYQVTAAESSRLALGYDIEGKRITAKETIADILYYANHEIGVAMAEGELSDDLDIIIPSEDVDNITCAEAITRVLRWFPGLVTRFRYADGAPPLPYLDIINPSDTTAHTLEIGEAEITTVNLTPRYDLQPEAVSIQYTRENSATDEDGEEHNYLSQFTDIYPTDKTGKELGSVRFTISLEGSRTVDTVQKIVAEEILLQQASWWKKHASFLLDERYIWIKDSNDNSVPFIIEDYGIEDDAGNILKNGIVTFAAGKTESVFEKIYHGDYSNGLAEPRALVSGSLDEINSTTNTDENDDEEEENTSKKLYQATVTAFAKITYAWEDKVGLASGGSAYYKREERNSERITVRVKLTNAHTQIHRTHTKDNEGETAAPGLAERFYNQTRRLRYDGGIELKGQEANTEISVGDTINLTNGRAEWATMGACVQSVSLSLDTGDCSLRIGSPSWLGPQDFIEFQRQTRGRKDAAPQAAKRKSGKADGQDKVEIPLSQRIPPPAPGTMPPNKLQSGPVLIRNTKATPLKRAETTTTTPPTNPGTTGAPAAPAAPAADGETSTDWDGADTEEITSAITVHGKTYDAEIAAATPPTPDKKTRLLIQPNAIEKPMKVREIEYTDNNGSGMKILAIASEPETSSGGGGGILSPVKVKIKQPDGSIVEKWSVTAGTINGVFPTLGGVPVGSTDPSKPENWAQDLPTTLSYIYAKVEIDDEYSILSGYEILYSQLTPDAINYTGATINYYPIGIINPLSTGTIVQSLNRDNLTCWNSGKVFIWYRAN